jgi:phage portal protein BeeE
VHGNTYVLKERDARGVVTALYLLHPRLVTVLVADDGSVYYELFRDNLSGLKGERLVAVLKARAAESRPTQ